MGSKISLDFEVILPTSKWEDSEKNKSMAKEQNICKIKGPEYCFWGNLQVGFVIFAIIFLTCRSCYTVYWEERQKRKQKKAQDLEKSNRNDLTSSNDNLFQEVQSEIDQFPENSALLAKKPRSRAISISRSSSSRTRT